MHPAIMHEQGPQLDEGDAMQQPDVGVALPRVSVLICTRNRGASILATIRSLQASTYANFELIIVDQSDDERTARAVARCRADARIRFVHTSTRGKSRANNIGLALISGEIVLMTDDDCEVPPDWIATLTASLLAQPRAGAVFCDVSAGPHDPSAGFVPISFAARPLLVRSLAEWRTCDGVNLGIGAGLAVRRTAAARVGGFDPLFGPGSHFRNSDDLDFALRLLAAGYQIGRITGVSVVHHGFRTTAQGRVLMGASMFATGAVYGRMARRGQLLALWLYAAVVWAMVLAPIGPSLLRRRVPPVLGRALWLLRGFVEGLCTDPSR